MLDKVRRAAISVEARFFDRDGLDGGPTAGFEALSECIEIDRPMCDADCFEHFDRHDLIKEAIDIPIVLQTDIDLVGETGFAIRVRILACSVEIVRPTISQSNLDAANSANPPQPHPISARDHLVEYPRPRLVERTCALRAFEWFVHIVKERR